MKRIIFGVCFFLVSLAQAEQCQITSPLPVPVTIQGCTFSGSLPNNSTSYIQNTLSPTTTTQMMSVERATATLSLTDSALAGSGTQCVQVDNTGLFSLSGSGACGTGGGGGGGTSSLAVQQNAINISSPTVAINFLAPPFKVALVNTSTSQITLDPSSVTLQGLITSATLGDLTTSSATATYLQLSSASITYLQGSSATITYLNVNQGLFQSSATSTYLQLSSAAATYVNKNNQTSGSGIVSPGTFTWTNTFGLALSTLAVTQTNTGSIGAVVITSTGTGTPLQITSQGLVSGGYQNKIGALTIGDDSTTRPFSTSLVVVDSAADAQNGGGMIEVWSDSPNHNDPKLWFHVTGHDSSPEIRDDANAPNWEMINLSTDNAHGMGKFEPAALAFQGTNLQAPNSRCYDNSGFENEAFWVPLQKPSAGFYLQSQNLSCDSGVMASSDTLAVNFLGQNGSSVGLTGPLNPSASWTFALPSTFNNQGQILYQADNGRGNNNNSRSWQFTVGGSSQQVLTNGGTGAPYWSTIASGGGGGSGSLVGNGNPYNVPYYSVASSNTLAASTIMALNPSSVTISGSLGLANTYGITAGSITVNGSGDGSIIETIGGTSYSVASSSGPSITAGHCASWTGAYTLTDSGAACGSGGTGGGASLSSTNTWTAQQTFQNTIIVSTTVALGSTGSVGTAGQCFLSQGNGTAPQWGSCGGTASPGGNPGNVQYNSAGTLAGASDFNIWTSSIQIGANNVYNTFISSLTASSSTFIGATMTVGNGTSLNVAISTGLSITEGNGNAYTVFSSTGYVMQASSNDVSSVLTPLPGFSFQIPAFSTWTYECHLGVTGAAGGSQYAVTGPSGSTLLMMATGNTGLPTAVSMSSSTVSGTAEQVVFGTTAVFGNINIFSEMTNGATAGVWALERKVVTPTSTALLAGSYCTGKRIQ